MIYCNLIQKVDGGAMYAFGQNTKKLDGVILFFSDDRKVSVVKEPEKKVNFMWVAKLYGRYRKQFSDGVFPQKISYEIG